MANVQRPSSAVQRLRVQPWQSGMPLQYPAASPARLYRQSSHGGYSDSQPGSFEPGQPARLSRARAAESPGRLIICDTLLVLAGTLSPWRAGQPPSGWSSSEGMNLTMGTGCKPKPPCLPSPHSPQTSEGMNLTMGSGRKAKPSCLPAPHSLGVRYAQSPY